MRSRGWNGRRAALSWALPLVLSSTSSQATAKVRVGEVPNRVAEEVQPEDREADREPRKEEHPGRGLHRLRPSRQHRAPGRLVGRSAEMSESARTMGGSAISASTTRWLAVSVTPPTYAVTTPQSQPSVTPSTTEASPT